MGIPYGDVTDGVDAKADGEASAKLEGVGSAYGYATAGVSAGDVGAEATDGVDENPADPVGPVEPKPIDGVDAPVQEVAAGVAVAIEYVEDAPGPSADGVSD